MQVSVVLVLTLIVHATGLDGTCVHTTDRYNPSLCRFVFPVQLQFALDARPANQNVLMIDESPRALSLWSVGADDPAAEMVRKRAWQLPAVSVKVSIGSLTWLSRAYTLLDDAPLRCGTGISVRYAVRASDVSVGGLFVYALSPHVFCALSTSTLDPAWGACEIATWAMLSACGEVSCPARVWTLLSLNPFATDVLRLARDACLCPDQLDASQLTLADNTLRNIGRCGGRITGANKGADIREVEENGARREGEAESEGEINDLAATVQSRDTSTDVIVAVGIHGVEGLALVVLLNGQAPDSCAEDHQSAIRLHRASAGSGRTGAHTFSLPEQSQQDGSRTNSPLNAEIAEALDPGSSAVPCEAGRSERTRTFGRYIELGFLAAGIMVLGDGTDGLPAVIATLLLIPSVSHLLAIRIIGSCLAVITGHPHQHDSGSCDSRCQAHMRRRHKYDTVSVILLASLVTCTLCRNGDLGFTAIITAILLGAVASHERNCLVEDWYNRMPLCRTLPTHGVAPSMVAIVTHFVMFLLFMETIWVQYFGTISIMTLILDALVPGTPYARVGAWLSQAVIIPLVEFTWSKTYQ